MQANDSIMAAMTPGGAWSKEAAEKIVETNTNEDSSFFDDTSVSKLDAVLGSVPRSQVVYAGRVKQYVRTEPKIGRNDPCPCGSGKKYKKCCLGKDE